MRPQTGFDAPDVLQKDTVQAQRAHTSPTPCSAVAYPSLTRHSPVTHAPRTYLSSRQLVGRHLAQRWFSRLLTPRKNQGVRPYILPRQILASGQHLLPAPRSFSLEVLPTFHALSDFGDGLQHEGLHGRAARRSHCFDACPTFVRQTDGRDARGSASQVQR